MYTPLMVNREFNYMAHKIAGIPGKHLGLLSIVGKVIRLICNKLETIITKGIGRVELP